ncbi:hypothetical protein DMC47_37375 [Nostoc sp. 3335mG]|nr:hypothetical protein DMC47_37375 [Nostoc sp. 3335mG]
MTDMQGKTAFVTGASGGIGRASAHALAKAGANVMIVDVEPDGLAETAAQLEAHGVGVATAIADVSDEAAVNAAVEETVRRFGAIDLAHNNAAIMGPVTTMLDYPLDVAHRMFDINVFGVLHCMRAELRHMLAQGKGAIVNTASVSGVHAVPNISIYTTTKHAVIGLTRSAAAEYSAQGVRINCVCPGFVLTNMTKSQFTEETEAVLAAQHPIGRFAQPEEIAEAVLWLLSDRASFSAGSAVFIDGGQTI